MPCMNDANSRAASRIASIRPQWVAVRNAGEALGLEGRILLHAGDRLLICSDGLSSVLTDEEIGRVLGQDAHDETACEVLVRGANLAGGPDNITVVLVTVGSTSDG